MFQLPKLLLRVLVIVTLTSLTYCVASNAIVAEYYSESPQISYETPNLQWDVCTILADNHGYSVGVVQFNTGTGSAQRVIWEYLRLLRGSVSSHEFSAYMPILTLIAEKAKNGILIGDVAGLEGFCDAWKHACIRKEFRDAQMAILDQDYWIPSQKLAEDVKAKSPAAKGQIFDSYIQMGPMGTRAILDAVMVRPDADESVWLQAFLNARRQRLNTLGGAYPPQSLESHHMNTSSSQTTSNSITMKWKRSITMVTLSNSTAIQQWKPKDSLLVRYFPMKLRRMPLGRFVLILGI
ncbi:hypothetical protein BC829DRAFT_416362 [Chytridium lagenaria]|nr:hypothetical protein BC829DRAFT_416362 [Chytridium lagenaria]